MTRPLTKFEFAQIATPIDSDRRQDVSVSQFLIANVMRGVALGVSFAILMLLTDTLGIFTLVMSQPAPVTTALIFVLVCSVKFVPAVLAVVLTVAAHTQ